MKKNKKVTLNKIEITKEIGINHTAIIVGVLIGSLVYGLIKFILTGIFDYKIIIIGFGLGYILTFIMSIILIKSGWRI